jgi:predicted pyridoxine 5'-phosphate oxidase superfamily flavin-nucleotide-binding protein
MLNGMAGRTPTPETSPFHAGELAVQEAAGVRDRAAKLGPMFRSEMADAYRMFFERLPFVLAGSVDARGQVWASMLIGEPGFVQSPDPETLMVFAQPNAADPLARAIREGAAIGLLGIELEARRRARVNGRVGEVGSKGFSIHVDQSYGNCPKYIIPREPTREGQAPNTPAPRIESNVLSTEALACIARADTCFIASASAAAPNATDWREGVDVSHRGGERGFVQADRRETGTHLWMPDYAGNNAFNTLGNLARYPHAGLLFPNFDSGDVLLVTCATNLHFANAETPNDAAVFERFSPAQRVVEFEVRNGLYFPGFMPFRWRSS